ncbi:MAG: hypothetical protein H6636_11635 [Anaerolineales bacterium]|nr:hypothetical protein [Anaerolineales bacterium]
MIFIQRGRTDEGTPIQPEEAWFTLAEISTQEAITEGKNHQMKASVYGHIQVRMALEALFYNKCAYCESEIRNDEWDIEHYRPKGRVAERADHPGYFWLAYQWTNLYPSCKFCNQHRKEKLTWGDLTRAEAGGKADQFPIVDENNRAMTPTDDISLELPLLLDPCADHPEAYLRFDPLGQIHSLQDNERGKATIEICFLNRRRLRALRRSIIQQVMAIVALMQGFEKSGNLSAVGELQNYLQVHHLADASSYAAVSRYIVAHPEEFGL